MNITNQFTLAAAVLLFCSCSSGVTIKTGDLRLRVDDRMQLSLQSDLARTPLVEANSTFSELCLEDGRELEYRLEDVSKSSVEDNFGKGVRYTVTGTAIAEDVRIEKRYVFSLYEQFPSFIVSKVEYRNLSDSPIGVKGWKSDIFIVIYPEGLPCVWSFQGQSTESREDWI
ncbi:MAG: hypothetical protein ACI39U_08100, partial [Candidatus Cryptobacteroides sp.]